MVDITSQIDTSGLTELTQADAGDVKTPIDDLIGVINNVLNGVQSFDALAIIESPAGFVSDLVLRSGTFPRWIIRKNATAETGGNAGSALNIDAHDDAGVFIDTAISILRATGGAITFNRPTVINNGLNIDANLFTVATLRSTTGGATMNVLSNGALDVAGFSLVQDGGGTPTTRFNVRAGGTKDLEFNARDDAGGNLGNIIKGERLTLNLGLNNFASFDATARGVISIAQGTAPGTSPANAVQVWAEDIVGTAELRVRDEAGNVTTLSPHNFKLFEPTIDHILPFSYYSKNPVVGKEINVDIYGAIKAIEQLTGQQFIFIADLPPEEILNWDTEQERERLRAEDLRRQWDEASEFDRQENFVRGEKPEPYAKKAPPKWINDRVPVERKSKIVGRI